MLTVTFDAATATPRELRAVAALVDSLLDRIAPVGSEAVPVVASPSTPPPVVPSAPAAPTPPAPVAPPVMPVPVASAPSVPPPGFVNAPDARGFTWDERIHSTARTQTQKGMWKYKRNLEDAVISSVEAEIVAARGSAPVAPPVVPSAPVAPAPLPPPATPVGDVPTVVDLFTEVARHAGRTPPLDQIMATVYPGVTLPDLMKPGAEAKRAEVYQWMKSI